MKKLQLLFCRHCGGEAAAESLGTGSRHFARIACKAQGCGIATPYCATPAIAAVIWHRRPQRKPPRRAQVKRLSGTASLD